MENSISNLTIVFDFLITVFENFLIIKTINLFFEEKKDFSLLYSVFVSLFSYILNYYINDVSIISFIQIFLIIFYSATFLIGNITKKIITVIFTYISLMIINMSIVILVSIFNVDLNSYFLQYNYAYFLIIIFQKFIFLLEYWFLKKYISKDSIISNKTSTYIALLLIFAILLTEVLLTNYISQSILSSYAFCILIGIIVIICLLIMKIYESILQDYNKIVEQQILLETTKQEERLLNLLNNKIDEINRLNHDFNNHKMILEKISSLDKAYMNEYASSYKPYSYINTDNAVLNYLLNEKINIAKNNNIDVKCIIEGSFKNTISNVDLCILLGNLLDNAIEATNNTDDSYISIKIKQDENTLLINVENNYQDIKIKKNKYISMKKEKNHGFGLSNISLICEKYGGSNYIQHKNNIFIHSCILLTHKL